MAEYIDIVLSQPDPSKPDEIFVEIEDPWGRSQNLGTDILPTETDPFRRIRISPADIQIIEESNTIIDA